MTEKIDLRRGAAPLFPAQRIRASRNQNLHPQHLTVSQSLEQSMERLSSVNMYYWPGPVSPRDGGVVPEKRFPLAVHPIGVYDIFEVLCSNRRGMKVLDELQGLDQASATALVNQHLSLALQEYTALYGKLMDEAQSRGTAQNEATPFRIGLELYVEDPPNGQTVVLGSRNKVLSLVLIAANLHLDGCNLQVRKTVEKAIEQRQFLYEDKTIDDFRRYDLLTRASLYERQVLATGVVDTTPRNSRLQQIIDEAHIGRREQLMTKFNAAVSPYDFFVRHGIMKPDYSRGEIKVNILSPMSDEVFDRIIGGDY